MTDFPVIHYLDASSLAESREDPAISPAKMEGGYILSRPRFTRRPRRTWAFMFDLVSDAHKATLEGFWDTVHGSSDMFNWTHPGTAEVIVVRFDPAMSKLKFSRIIPGAVGVWKTDTIILTEV
jgi:phage-related protein